jgi:hypothetical protein
MIRNSARSGVLYHVMIYYLQCVGGALRLSLTAQVGSDAGVVQCGCACSGQRTAIATGTVEDTMISNRGSNTDQRGIPSRGKLIISALAGGAALGLMAMVPVSSAQAQSPGNKDVLYDTSTPAKGACPGMDWHIVVHSDKTANGMVSWGGSKNLVHLTGTMDDHGALKMNATDGASNKTDTVTGTVDGNVLKAQINGTGTPCDNETMNVPKATNPVSRG